MHSVALPNRTVGKSFSIFRKLEIMHAEALAHDCVNAQEWHNKRLELRGDGGDWRWLMFADLLTGNGNNRYQICVSDEEFV